MKTLAGIDAGGSHTEAVVSDESPDILARHRGAPAAVRPDTIPHAAAAILDTLHGALAAAGREVVTAVAVGAAGAGRAQEQTALTQALQSRLGSNVHVAVSTDADIALEDAFPNAAPGIIVISGTGSVAFARDADGRIWRSGGLGPELGDEGSGYIIAREALRAVGRAAEDRRPPTDLRSEVHRVTKTDTLADLVRWTQLADRETVAALARAVCDSADRGDPTARTLVTRAGLDLATLVARLATHFAGDVRVSFAGGILVTGSPVRAATEKEIAARIPQAHVTEQPVDAARGALRIAARLLG